ncbi:MAG: hypothetical protein JWO05_2930 [Gemmatimonadetes bacterium]|nr:hypothetical protein [Gemmatimonadota bacterium]
MNKKYILSLLLVAAASACRTTTTSSQPGNSAPTTPGATSPKLAVLTFLNAAKLQDLQAMSLVWGDAKGPARSSMQRDDLEKRELVMMCYFNHETATVLNDSPSQNNERILSVQLKKGPLEGTTNFYAVRGPEGRWFVRSAELEPLQKFCQKR